MCPNTGGTREISQECVAESSNRDSADEDANATEKYGDGNDTQDLECRSADRSLQEKDAKGVGSVSVNSLAVAHEKEQTDTERAFETESQAGEGTFQRCFNMEGEMMQLDGETLPVENFGEPVARPEVESGLDDTEQHLVRTADLLTSEPVGSWAVSTDPSAKGEHESPGKVKDDEAFVADALMCLGSQVSESHSNKGNESRKLTNDQKRLNAMIEIADPEFGHKFAASGGVGKGSDISDAETGSDFETKDDNADDDTKDGVDGSDAVMKDSVG